MPTDEPKPRWAMAYHLSRNVLGRPEATHGFTVTDEHPVGVVARWNARSRARDAAHQVTAVLTWFAPLSPDEAAALEAAGLDLTAQDAEGWYA